LPLQFALDGVTAHEERLLDGAVNAVDVLKIFCIQFYLNAARGRYAVKARVAD